MARSLYIEAIQHAKNNDFQKAQDSLEEADELFIEGHKVHAKLLSKEATGDDIPITLLLLHAEDQFMSTDTFKILANEFIDLYKRIEQIDG